jgi:hypothetical protein
MKLVVEDGRCVTERVVREIKVSRGFFIKFENVGRFVSLVFFGVFLKFYDRAGIGPCVKIQIIFVYNRSMEGGILFVCSR